MGQTATHQNSARLSQQFQMLKTRQFVRWASKKAAEAPKVDQKQLAQQREREQKRMAVKRENARALAALKDEARLFKAQPHSMSVPQALRYIRAAEVGKSAHATTIFMEMRIVAERGVPKINGTCRLPHPLDEERICVLTGSAEVAEQARALGAVAGGEALINEMRDTEHTPYDRIYATPEIMPRVNQIARMLGPKGLMPSAKRNTVTSNIIETLEAARGETTIKQQDTFLRIPVGRASFTDTAIVQNALEASNTTRTLLNAVQSAKKGSIGRTLITSTLSPSIVVEV